MLNFRLCTQIKKILKKSVYLCALVFCFDYSPLAAEDLEPSFGSSTGYTINYTNVSILEYIRFVSKITNVNFIFNEDDLNFTVTVVSEDSLSTEAIMSTLIQILRVHNLYLLEENNNLVIHKNPDVKQLAHIVIEGEDIDKRFPVTTRIFRIKDNKASSIAGIIRPMISQEAVLDILEETNHIVLTDVTPNVEKVALLIENLDTAASPLVIETYRVKQQNAGALINIAHQIMAPLAQGHPFILVPQSTSDDIFLVSTPALVEKAVSVLQNLDILPKKGQVQNLGPENLMIYKVQHRSVHDVVRGLDNIVSGIKSGGYAERNLVSCIEHVQPLQESNALFFTGDPTTFAKIKEFLTVLDSPYSEGAIQAEDSFLLYKPLNRTPEDIVKSIHEISTNLIKSKMDDTELIQALESARVISTTQSVIFTGMPAVFSKIKEILHSVDIPGKYPASEAISTFTIYKIKNIPENQLTDALHDIVDNLKKSGVQEQGLIYAIDSMKYIPETDSMMFTGDQKSLSRLQDLLPLFDQKIGDRVSTQFLIYKPKYLYSQEIYKSLKEYTAHLQSSNFADFSLLQALHSVKLIKSTNSLLFTGDPASLNKIEKIIQSIDSAGESPGLNSAFYIYQLQYVPKDKVQHYLYQVADKLARGNAKEDDLIKAIDSMQWIPESHSFMFTGTQNALARIKELLTSFDIVSDKAIAKIQPTFIVYQPQYVTKERLETYIKQIAGNLNRSSEKQEHLYQAIHSIKWIAASHSFMFSGTTDALTELQSILQTFDVPDQKRFEQSVLTYIPKYISRKKFESYFDTFLTTLQHADADPDLTHAVESMHWLEESHAFVFSGTEKSLQRITELIKGLDIETEKDTEGYFLYKLKYTQGDHIEATLEKFATDMKDSGLEEAQVIQVVDNLKWIKATNSLLLTGPQKGIEEVKELIAEYDNPEFVKDLHSQFLIYKPKFVSVDTIKHALTDLASTLKKGGLVDKSLLNAIDSMRYSDTTQSLVFTGNSLNLTKIEDLLKEIDNPASGGSSIQQLGKTTFLLYKLKQASGSQVLKSLNNVIKDLKRSGTSDEEFLHTLESMKYIRETNSLLFTGPNKTLERVRALVAKFDISALAAQEAPADFFIYHPEYVSGTHLENLLTEFADHLKDTGLSDPGLFHAIQSMKYIEKSHSLVFVGDSASLAKTKDLLKTFDVNTKESAPSTEIQTVDNTSFLVYKLQYHKGSEIQTALHSIGKDLLEAKTVVNQTLINSIHSIQWLELTNSLLCTGDQETLTRLKELIKNLDVPLKQVFIEMLVIETTLSNFLDFGLDWGAKAKYKNKFAASTSNFNSQANTSGSGSNAFANNLGNVGATTKPSPTQIPFQTGFDFGVIGDIILHKGKSFISMGSLINALQQDSQSSILLTPKIVTQDNKTSNLFVGRNIPFAGSFVSNVSDHTVNTSNLEYRDIGVNLTITPVLGNSDVVTLSIDISNTVIPSDAQGEEIDTYTGRVQGITTEKTSMTTTVHVPNESFLVLSGMLNVLKSKSTNGIPCLGGIPLIGAAFSLLEDRDVRDNIVIFIRPRVIKSYDDMIRITQDQENLFREESGSAFLEKQFDESMELIKSVEDE
jgi:type III secretion protein C